MLANGIGILAKLEMHFGLAAALVARALALNPISCGALFAGLPGVLCARGTFSHAFSCTRIRDPLFCILPPFSDTFLRLKRRKMFVSAGRNNSAAE